MNYDRLDFLTKLDQDLFNTHLMYCEYYNDTSLYDRILQLQNTNEGILFLSLHPSKFVIHVLCDNDIVHSFKLVKYGNNTIGKWETYKE